MVNVEAGNPVTCNGYTQPVGRQPAGGRGVIPCIIRPYGPDGVIIIGWVFADVP